MCNRLGTSLIILVTALTVTGCTPRLPARAYADPVPKQVPHQVQTSSSSFPPAGESQIPAITAAEFAELGDEPSLPQFRFPVQPNQVIESNSDSFALFIYTKAPMDLNDMRSRLIVQPRPASLDVAVFLDNLTRITVKMGSGWEKTKITLADRPSAQDSEQENGVSYLIKRWEPSVADTVDLTVTPLSIGMLASPMNPPIDPLPDDVVVGWETVENRSVFERFIHNVAQKKPDTIRLIMPTIDTGPFPLELRYDGQTITTSGNSLNGRYPYIAQTIDEPDETGYALVHYYLPDQDGRGDLPLLSFWTLVR